MKKIFIKKTIAKVMTLVSVLLMSAFVSVANASQLSTDLQNLLVEVQTINAQIGGTTLTSENMCSDLLSINKSSAAFIENIESVTAGLSSPLTIDTQSLQALDDLSAEFVSMADSSTALSLNLTALNSTTDMLAISNALSAMLRLADDIGKMADRILEMSDKILIMADNIGLMADRIIVTQQIQSDNLALTQSSILATQTNSIALVSVVDSSIYNADFDAQTLVGNILSFDISATALNVFNMSREWSSIATDIESLKAQIEMTHAAITGATEANTVYADVDSYTALAEMSIMVNSVAIATQGLALVTEGLSPITSDSKLEPSMDSILQLSADIGVMAGRILEMADLILAMSDNIGLTADQIIATQQLQSTNYAATLGSVEATQSIAISIIAVNSL